MSTDAPCRTTAGLNTSAASAGHGRGERARGAEQAALLDGAAGVRPRQRWIRGLDESRDERGRGGGDVSALRGSGLERADDIAWSDGSCSSM